MRWKETSSYRTTLARATGSYCRRQGEQTLNFESPPATRWTDTRITRLCVHQRRTMDDRSVGLAICFIATALFAYYTVWILVTPFVEPGHAVSEAAARELPLESHEGGAHLFPAPLALLFFLCN